MLFFNNKLLNRILIEFDTSAINSHGGPGSFVKGLYKFLPFSSDNCIFISSSFINFIYNFDYYYLPIPKFNRNNFDKLAKMNLIKKYILGPTFVPNKWESFPNTSDWKEEKFSEILNLSKGIVVHSNRVKNYLSQKSNTTNNIRKFKIIRACSNLKPKKINSFQKRKIDLLFFEKYSDVDHSNQGKILLSLFRQTNKNIISIKYGTYTKKSIKSLANNSKFVVYFSFYDTGAIGLKEIQNYGVFCFTHQMDLVIDNETSFFIPELTNQKDMYPAFKKIIGIIERISSKNPNSQLIAKRNQFINNCQNALKDLCESLN